MKSVILTSAVLLMALCVVPAAAAPIQALTITVASNNGAGDYDLGYMIKPVVNIQVTALGYFSAKREWSDANLIGDHEVALFSTDGNHVKLASVVINSSDTFGGEPNTSLDSWYWEDLASPVSLEANTVYMMCGSQYGDYWNSNVSLTTDANYIVIANPGGATGNGFYTLSSDTAANYPDTGHGEYGFFTSNLKFVPEPATMALLALGGVALIRRRRRV